MPFDKTAYQREYMRKRRAAQAQKAALEHALDLERKAQRIAAYVSQHLGGVCRVPQDVPALMSALQLDVTDWTRSVNHLGANARVRWSGSNLVFSV